MNNLEKILTAQLYMAGNCTYAATWKKNGANTAWGSLVYKNSKGYHEAQCSGYARGFKALCDAMGIKCRYVHANSKSINPSHQWDEVKLNGIKKHILPFHLQTILQKKSLHLVMSIKYNKFKKEFLNRSYKKLSSLQQICTEGLICLQGISSHV